MQGHRNGWLPGCTAMPGHWLIACGDVGETSAICCQEASRLDASLSPVLGFGCFFAGVWEKNLWLFCASAAASFGIERKSERERERKTTT